MFKVYYMLNNITVKIDNNYVFLNKMSRSNLGLKSQTNYKLERREYFVRFLMDCVLLPIWLMILL